MSPNPIGKNLRLLREKCGYTQQHLANALNIDRSTYSYYEAGKTTPDISSLILLSNIFAVTLTELLGQEEFTPALNDSCTKPPSRRSTDNNSHIYDLKKDELQLIAFFRAATPQQKQSILDQLSQAATRE